MQLGATCSTGNPGRKSFFLLMKFASLTLKKRKRDYQTETKRDTDVLAREQAEGTLTFRRRNGSNKTKAVIILGWVPL